MSERVIRPEPEYERVLNVTVKWGSILMVYWKCTCVFIYG